LPTEPESGGGSGAELEDHSDKLLHLEENSQDCTAVIDGRSYVFYCRWEYGCFVGIPRPLDTEKYRKEVIRPRIMKLVQTFKEKRTEEREKRETELRNEVDQILQDEEAKAQVTEGLDAIICLVNDCHWEAPLYHGRAYINGERFTFRFEPRFKTLSVLQGVRRIESYLDGERTNAICERLRKLLMKEDLRRARRIKK
jgi:hypothetical protein